MKGVNEIKDVVSGVLDQIQSRGSVQQDDTLQRNWKKILQTESLAHGKIYGLKNDTLLVNVDSSARLYGFRLKEGKILKALQKDIPQIRKIRFRIGKTDEEG